MAKTPAKLVVLGLDAAIPRLIKEFVAEGVMPNTAKLMHQGTSASVVTTFPPLTAAAWAAITTGAGPGTAGIPSLMVHLPGEPLDQWHTSFDKRMLLAETLWEAATRVGKRTALINWPVTFPMELKDGVQVAASLNPPFRFFYMPLFDLASSALFATERYACNQVPGRAVVVQPTRASGWINAPKSRNPILEAEILVPPTYITSIPYHVAIYDSRGEGYDRVLIAPNKNGAASVADLALGEMSDWIVQSFETPEGKRRGRFRFQLIGLTADARRFSLYVSAINTAEPYTIPPSFTQGLEAAAGPYLEVDDPWSFLDGWVNMEMYMTQLETHVEWWVKATTHTLANSNWDMAYSWVGVIDHLQHVVWGGIDPKCVSFKADEFEKWMSPLRKLYQMVDRGIGRILEKIDLAETLVLIVSDHGFAHIDFNPYLKRLLANAGLLSFALDPQTGEMVVDWSKTKCFPLEPCHAHIFVNLKGRDPHGIVKPEDYERVQQEIIEALLNMRDPRTGDSIVSMAIRKQEAGVLGVQPNQGFDRVGDVLFAFKPGYIANPFVYPATINYPDGTRRVVPNPEEFEPAILGRHFTGIHLTSPTLEEMHAFMLLAGPGVRHQDRRQPVNVVDIAPTVAYMLGTPIPKDAEGDVLRDVPVGLWDKRGEK
jgi:predicted AlkP superfamily phosphohydrolase/phosphomutase